MIPELTNPHAERIRLSDDDFETLERTRPWQRLANESAQRHTAFTAWSRAEPSQRSLNRTARQLGVAEELLVQWHYVDRWDERVKCHDAYFAEVYHREKGRALARGVAGEVEALVSARKDAAKLSALIMHRAVSIEERTPHGQESRHSINDAIKSAEFVLANRDLGSSDTVDNFDNLTDDELETLQGLLRKARG